MKRVIHENGQYDQISCSCFGFCFSIYASCCGKPGLGELPRYREAAEQFATDYEEVNRALSGESGGMVRLDIFQEVSAVVQSAVIDANQLGPVTTIRSATTSVVVRDDQTVVIGGLISDAVDNFETGVPFLSDIPILGNFLRRASEA